MLDPITWDRCADLTNWEHNPARYRYTSYPGPYILHVDHSPTGTTWQVEHEQFGVLKAWTGAIHARAAVVAAIAFARQHEQGRYEPQHLEQ